MQLIFKSKHLSIDQFDAVDVPDFVVLTGVNGSGKSHLLEALEKRKVVVQGMESAHIVLFNYENFRLENESAFNAHQIAEERESAWNFHQQQVINNAKNWRNTLGATYEPLKAECQANKRSFWSSTAEQVKQYRQSLKNYFTASNIKNNQQAQRIFSLAKSIPYSLDELQHDDFVRLYKPFVYKNDFLPHQLGKVFWDYYIKYRSNQVNEFENARYGKNYPVLSEEDFIKQHGEKPWEIVNQILETFDSLKYRVNSPEGADYFGSFQLKLRHLERENLEVDFSALSSGEKILMALVASVYKSASDKNFPDILLLDEVDASLHPSMMKNMLEVIRNIFLKQGVKVLLVTHSPTTIALAPEDSIYVVNRSGQRRVEKKSKQDALSILTQGFATIEQGLRLFDEVAKAGLTVITEGRNAELIVQALRVHGLDDVDVLSGVEGVSGKNQLKTLFDFFSRTSHLNKVIFVWDCDVTYDIQPSNNTYPYFLQRNDANAVAKSGIENMFPEALFEGFKKTITLSTGETLVEFDSGRKRDFERFVIERGSPDDFQGFSTLAQEIKRIKSL